MKYRVALPLTEAGAGRARLNILDPVTTDSNRALAERGFADTEAATNAVLLAAFEAGRAAFTFVDVGAGIGAAAMLCGTFFRPRRIVAIEPTEMAVMLERIADANRVRLELAPHWMTAFHRHQEPCRLVVRIGATVDEIETLEQMLPELVTDHPPVVITGDRDDRTLAAALAKATARTDYEIYPLRRYPTWRALRPGKEPPPNDGWLLYPGAPSREFRDRHLSWAGALGACTPDHNDRDPFAAELRVAARTPSDLSGLGRAVRRDVRRGARKLWHRVDPWLPSPQARTGRWIDGGVAWARARL